MAVATKEPVLTAAVDLARQAAQDVADRPELVGEHLGVTVDGDRLLTHRFATTAVGYRGWHWAVTVARVPRGRVATICEVDLLPGDDAILAPAWVPWSDRLQPGDLGPGDVLPYLPDDDRLEQGYEATGDLDADELALFELGLGRERVLSAQGRAEAAERWYAGSHGPLAPTAVAASAPCSTCAFLVLMAGSLRTEFGVCANEWSPDDGRVVSMDHGCGAHSQTDEAPAPSDWPDPAPVVDEMDVELVDLSDGEKAEPSDGDKADAPDGENAEPSDEGSTTAEAAPSTETESPGDAESSAEAESPAADAEPSADAETVTDQE